MGFRLSKTLPKFNSLGFVVLLRILNDPKPEPLAVTSVITPAAVAVEIDPPKAKAVIINLDKLFISFLLMDKLYVCWKIKFYRCEYAAYPDSINIISEKRHTTFLLYALIVPIIYIVI